MKKATHPDLFDIPKQQAMDERLRDETMGNVSANAGDAWNTYAHGLIRTVAQRLGHFTSDDVMDAMKVPPHDPRALGPAMVRAAKAGMIEQTNTFRMSRRRHASPIRVWNIKRH